MYLGDIPLSQTIDFTFTTYNVATGAPHALSGGAVSVYVGNSDTQTTTGVTLTADFDGVTGLNHVRIATSDAFYATGSDFHVILTAGTVNSVSAVGSRLAEFSIQHRSALRPTTSGRTLDVSAGGEAGVDWANVGSPTTSLNLSGTTTAAVTGAVGSVTGAVGSVTGAVGSVTGNVGGNVVGSVGSLTTNNDKTGYALSSSGLDSVSTTAPSGVASNFREMVVQTWRRMFKKSTLTSSELKTFADDGSTVVTTQTVSDSGGTQTQGAAS